MHGILDGGGDDCLNAFAERCGGVFGEVRDIDRVMEMDGDGGGPEHPIAGAMMVEGADNADGSDGDSEMERQSEGAILELADVTVARAAGFGGNDEARAGLQ